MRNLNREIFKDLREDKEIEKVNKIWKRIEELDFEKQREIGIEKGNGDLGKN